MAIPYLLLCYSPALLQRLPRPGAWMVRFKELLAFPMFASAIWLVWVLSQQAGPNGVLAVLAGMLMLALALWLSNHRGRGTASRWLTLAIALALAAVALALPIRLHREVPVSVAGTAVAVDTGYDGPHWETWSQERLAAMRATGPVFVNFMAAWCITCKVNEAVALDSMTIRDAFERKGVQYLKGDWTNEDPDITRALAEYERSGVPLYLLYRQGEGRATVLPQILTESTVLAAIEGL
jgi:thiol:disulfide interchange protein